MVGIQIGIIVFLILILIVVYHDEYRKRKLGRKSARLNRFWKDGEERRQTVRINTEIGVLYEIDSADDDKQKRITMSRNISLGGINLALDEKLLPGTVLDLQLNTDRPIFAKGKVVWVQEVPAQLTHKKDRIFSTGIQFIQVKPQDESLLRGFIEQKMKNANIQNGSKKP